MECRKQGHINIVRARYWWLSFERLEGSHRQSRGYATKQFNSR